MAVFALEVLYLVAMNAFLSTPLFERFIDATPDVVDIHYTRGWSFFPTRIHARGLSIRGTDSHVEWILRFDEVDFDCSLTALAHQEFHVTRARGTGITFRARMKVAAPEATAENTRFLPPIDSLGAVGLIPSTPPYAGEWNDKEWHLWTVRIDDAVAEHVREIWIQGGRLQGDARVTGGFYLKPIRAAEVMPAHVEVRSGSVAYDARIVASPLVASVDFKLARFDPRVATGVDILHHVSLSVDAATTIPDLGDLALSLPDSGQLAGRLDIPRLALRLEKGVIADDTAVEAHGAAVRATTAADVVTGRVDLAANVVTHRLVVLATLGDLEADLALSIPRLAISADSEALDIGEPFSDLHGILDVPEAELRHASRLTKYLPGHSSARITHGEIGGALHAEGWRATNRVQGSCDLHAKGLDLVEGSAEIGGDFHASGHALLENGRKSGTFDLRSPDMTLKDERRHGGLAVTAHARAHTAGASSDALSLDELHIVAERLVLADDTSRSSLSIGRLSLDAADAQVTKRAVHGSASLDARDLRYENEEMRVAGNADAFATVSRWDFEKKTLGGDIAVAFRNVSGGFGSRGVPDLVADRVDVRASASGLDLAKPSMVGVDYGLRVERAELADARSLNRFLPSPSIMALESGRAFLSADIATSGPARTAGGQIDLSLADGGIRLHQTHLAGDFALTVIAHGYDSQRAVADLEGSHLAMRNVRVTGASTDTSAWSGDLMLESGTLDLGSTPGVEGDLTLHARDASPILGVLFRDSLPHFVAQLTDMPSLTAVAHLTVDPENIAISDLFVTGGDLALRGTYVAHEADRRAVFVVQKGPFSAGVSVDGDGAHVRLFGLDGWYASSQQALLQR